MLKRNPIMTITLGFICTFVLMLTMAWHLYTDQSDAKKQLIELEKVENIRYQLNQFYNDLTTLLRLQIVHPTTKNYQSYQQLVSSLNQVMKDAKVFATENDVLPVYYKLQKLQNEIIATQKEVLQLIQQKNITQVESILLNPKYHDMEVEYASTVLQLINANSSYQYWLSLCNDLLMYQNYQTSLMYLLLNNTSFTQYANYNIYHSRISHLLKEAIEAPNPIIKTTPFKQASKDYQSINRMNMNVDNYLKQGMHFQARSILLSSQYKQARTDYNKQIIAASEKIKGLIGDKIQSATYTHDLIAITLLVIMIIFLFIWIVIISMTRHWKNKLVQANNILDKKVEKRTKKLIEEIKAHKEAEKQKTQLETVLRQNQKLHSVGVLAAGIAHDFNNLLAIILANAEGMILHEKDNQEAQEGLVNAANEAGHLTRQLLTFARKTPQTKSNANLNDIVIKTMDLLEPSLPHNITIQAALCSEPLMVEVDTSQVTQVLLNIGINAKDAMPEGGIITYESCIKHTLPDGLALKHLGPFACINIIDTGTGIAEEDLPFIFDPFFTKKAVDKGTGLGLATAYGIMQQHKGDISVQSHSTGTTFTLLFPIKDRS